MDNRRKYDWEEIQKFYDEGNSWRKLSDKFGVSMATIQKASKRGEFKTRTRSEAMKMSNKKYPRKHSEETKRKISIARKKFLKENPDKVPYLLNHNSKNNTYPEKYFKECLKNTPLQFKYRYLNYELDFVDLVEGVVLEIDGEQHYVDPRIVEHDKKRNKRLLDDGFKIIRVRWKEYQKLDEISRRAIVSNIISYAPFVHESVTFYGFEHNENNKKYLNLCYKSTKKRKKESKEIKILSYDSPKIKKKSLKLICECGNPKTYSGKCCRPCSLKKREVIDWPNSKILQNMLWKFPTSTIARELGVSDKAIEKRCKKLNLTKPPRGYWAKKKVHPESHDLPQTE